MARSKFEKRAQKELESKGYKVDYKIRPTRPNPHYNTDFFNVFDLLAHRDGEPLRMISIKGTGGVPSGHRRDIEEFDSPGNHREVWYYRKTAADRRKFVPKKELFTDAGWITLEK